MMAAYFSLGVGQLWDELQQMQATGLYWTHLDKKPDVSLWCRQVLGAQAEDTQVALVTLGESPSELLNGLDESGPKRLPLFSLPATPQAISRLPSDLNRALKLNNHLLVLGVSARTWQQHMNEHATHLWLAQMAAWLRQKKCGLLVVSYGAGGEALRMQLQHEHRSLMGLARLRHQQESHRYQLVFWGNQKGLSANQELTLEPSASGWQLAASEQPPTPSINDEHQFLCQESVLQGSRPLSEHWQLFTDNRGLAEAGLNTQSATLIFALQYNRDIEEVARQLHQLRHHCGKSIKLIVREVGVSLRQADERLLLACGANLVVSHHVPLSRFLVQLEGLQGQRFARHVPADITPLIDALIPLKLKGVLRLEPFCTAVTELMTHPLVATDTKGVLVAIQPVAGLKAAQALTLCRLNRMGDLATVADDTLFMFLFSCSINDVNLALGHIFKLPVAAVILQHHAWHQDLQILTELRNIRRRQPSNWLPPKLVAKLQANVSQVLDERRQPQAISLPLFRG